MTTPEMPLMTCYYCGEAAPCRVHDWPPVKTYGCTVAEINTADDEGREAMRQLLWAVYDYMLAGGNHV
jgi:hypothetical protein